MKIGDLVYKISKYSGTIEMIRILSIDGEIITFDNGLKMFINQEEILDYVLVDDINGTDLEIIVRELDYISGYNNVIESYIRSRNNSINIIESMNYRKL